MEWIKKITGQTNNPTGPKSKPPPPKPKPKGHSGKGKGMGKSGR